MGFAILQASPAQGHHVQSYLHLNQTSWPTKINDQNNSASSSLFGQSPIFIEGPIAIRPGAAQILIVWSVNKQKLNISEFVPTITEECIPTWIAGTLSVASAWCSLRMSLSCPRSPIFQIKSNAARELKWVFEYLYYDIYYPLKTYPQLSESPDWPNRICTSCALLLRAALKLRSLCQQTEKDLKEQKLQEINIEIVHDEQETKKKTESRDLSKNEATGSDSELEYEYLESYDVTLESSEDVACSADELVSIEPAISAPEESVYSLSPKPVTFEDEDSGQAASFTCNICHNVYSERVKLTNHMKVHSAKKPHECE